MTSVDLRGAQLRITTPSGQPCEVLFDFGSVNVSAWTWRGQVRSDPTSAVADATFTFTNPTPSQVLAALSKGAIDSLEPTTGWQYEIDQLTPTLRQAFWGALVVIQDTAR